MPWGYRMSWRLFQPTFNMYHVEVEQEVIKICDQHDANGLNLVDKDANSIIGTEPDLSDMQVPEFQSPPWILIIFNLPPGDVDVKDNSEEVVNKMNNDKYSWQQQLQ